MVAEQDVATAVETQRPRAGRIVFGTVLMIVGALLALDRLELLEMGPLARFWPLALMAIGLSKLWQTWGTLDTGSGLFMVLAGLWFLVINFKVFGLTFHNAWPLLLVGAGITMVWRGSFESRRKRRTEEVHDGR